ncbi:hypothetical protein MSAN_01811000 [Mycena sanguinolenta]|uniref:Uncharacterized protein n=1 Tax=Mycena sanguinolenta TaxID=230812 RepID=A0A8H6XT47_9AGAR|nr:hypothetical protein MSAN_01811000 [Mycena sanguinolenta]
MHIQGMPTFSQQNNGTDSHGENDALSNENSRQPPEDGVGGRGGLGQGPSVVIPIGDTIGQEIQIQPMDIDEFCTRYDLGDDILSSLNNNDVELDVGALIRASNLMNPSYRLKLGQVAEVKWALKVFLLSHPSINELQLPPGLFKATVIGGRGGDGGRGGLQGGTGGTGKAPKINWKEAQKFERLVGGTGGAGGYGGATVGALGKSQNPNGQERTPPPQGVEDGRIQGGRGVEGGWGIRVGGVGGVGGAPVVPLEAVGTFKWIEGGRGGTGGESKETGGKGGDGEGPVFPQPLVVIDRDARLMISANNVKLREGQEINPQLRALNVNITEELIDRLDGLGFRTIGGLFEIYDADLDVEPFETGDKDSLKLALEQFRNIVVHG